MDYNIRPEEVRNNTPVPTGAKKKDEPLSGPSSLTINVLRYCFTTRSTSVSRLPLSWMRYIPALRKLRSFTSRTSPG